LLVAGQGKSGWTYVGSVGSGFNLKDATSLRSALDGSATSTPAVQLKGKNLVVVEPLLVAEIEFRSWTNDGNLRHASFKGLREVQDSAAVFNAANRTA